jgi:ketosteroid isomerase-like protein
MNTLRVLGRILPVLPILPMLTCTVRAGEPRGLSAADVASIKAADKAWGEAALARDWDKVAALYTTDAILLPPNAPAVEGRENIRKNLANFPPLSKMDITVLETRGEGNLAYVRGAYTMTIPVEKGDLITETGKFLEIRLRQPNGEWLLYRDMYSSDNAPAPAPPAASKP